jgi:hypothetical protein
MNVCLHITVDSFCEYKKLKSPCSVVFVLSITSVSKRSVYYMNVNKNTKCEQSQYTFNLFASAQTLKMWTLQITLNGLDFKNTDTPSQITLVTHLNNSNFENADTLIHSEYTMPEVWYVRQHFSNICTVQTWQMWAL